MQKITGIPSQVATPMIAVNVYFPIEDLSHELDWTVHDHTAIQHYEKKDNTSTLNQKLFPEHLPLSLLFNRKDHEIITLTVHGYETQLICTLLTPESGLRLLYAKEYPFTLSEEEMVYFSSNESVPQTFPVYMNFLTSTFLEKKYFIYGTDVSEFIEHGLLKIKDKNIYEHGDNVFKNIADLFIPDRQALSRMLLLFCELQRIISPD